MKRVDNPPNPYLSTHSEWLEPPPPATVEIYEEHAKSILSENDSPDLPFRWSANPYRGCQHACAYCYARTYHEFLGMGAGTDFDTKLIAKVNAPDLLRAALTKRTWQGESINFSGVTDCYQPIEASYHLTRECLRVCLELGNPAVIVTKGCLVMRDAELLAELNRKASARVFQSIPFADDRAARLIEPQAPPPSRRFEVMKKLTDAGVPVGVLIAPVIPGLSDRDIPAILRRAAECGARSASYMPLRLPGSVEPVFLSRLREAMPLQAKKIESRLREVRGGRLNEGRFGQRMKGTGRHWESVEELFRVWLKRTGLGGIDRPRAMPQADKGSLSASPASGGERLSRKSLPVLQEPSGPGQGGQLVFDFSGEA